MRRSSHIHSSIRHLGLLLLLSVAASADEKLLRDALHKDDTLGEISNRLGDMVERQAQSSVFQAEEVQKTEDTSDTIDTARTTAMQDVISELSGFVSARNARPDRQVLANSKTHYERLLEILRGLKERSDELEERQAVRDLLQEQRELLEETEARPTPEERQTTMEAIDAFADLAERQEELRRNAPDEQVEEPMASAEKALSQMKPEQAAAFQKQVIEQLEEKLAAPEGGQQLEEQDPLSQIAERINALQDIEQKLSRIEGQLRHAEKRHSPPKPEFQQETALELNEHAKELRELNQPEPAKDVIEAIPPLMQAEWEPSADEVKEARDKIKQAVEFILQKLQEQAEQAEDQEDEQQQKRQNQHQIALQAGEKSRPKSGRVEREQVAVGAGWLSSLPDRERDAVLSARSARYNPKWETEVKRYFVELAK
ncbi:MAG: hypothetical protein HN742_36385 [Lentisphaerae bacterium]|jgi:hypothetical protein|nr:hypothetical protein [Lentisphaerota bacterium]MBT4820686.1 hypothetical protein [Lentisphaerota bacterium]MBT5610618.1 hypothetical protein [Lentisphaerota bacterium]MBT7053865.1 hypothetical protein [Lentisphaerota bacterium]MBT7847403.1 hypothetical protein [Lentisphaerota bacterium]